MSANKKKSSFVQVDLDVLGDVTGGCNCGSPGCASNKQANLGVERDALGRPLRPGQARAVG